MSRNKKILIGVGVVLVLGAIAFANFKFKRTDGLDVNTEAVQKRRPRGDRVRVRQDPAEARRQHQRRHDGPGHRPGGRRRRPRHQGAVPPADRSAQPADGGAADEASLAARRSQVEQLRRSIESSKVALKQAQDNYTRQQNLWKGGLTHARDARARGERPASCAKRTSGRRSSTCGRRRSASSPGEATVDERPVRPEQGADRVADHRHRHAPQHRRGGNGRHRDDEQRRHGAADDRRHVGHRGGGRGRRDRHPERAARADGQGHDRRDAGQDVHRQGDRDRQQPDPGGRPAPRRRRRTSRSWSRSTARSPTCGRASPARPRSRPRRATDVVAVPIQATTVREVVVDDKGNIVRPPQDRSGRAGRAPPPRRPRS